MARGGRWFPLLWTVVVLCNGVSASPLSLDSLESEEDVGREEMVVRLELEGHVLADSEYLIRKDDRIFYPLDQLARHLELDIEVDPLAGEAQGWVLDPEREFEFSLDRREWRLGDERRELASSEYIEEHSDIYLREDVLTSIIPLELEYQSHQSAIQATAEESLPILTRLEREARWESLSGGSGRSADEDWLPRREHRPRALSRPAWSLSMSQSLDEAGGRSRGDLGAAGDLLWHESQWRVQMTDDEGVRRFDGTLAREFDRSYLQRYELGRTTLAGHDLVRRRRTGAGVSVTNRPEGAAQATFSDHVIDGEAPAGWAVELYREGDLIDFQEVDEDGRFEFTQIDAFPGTNRYEIELYGPHGERETRRRTIEIGPGLLPPGTVHYTLDAGSPGRSLYRATERDRASWSSARAEVGITPNLAAGADVHRFVPGEQDVAPEQDVGAADLSLSAFGLWTRLRAAASDTGEHAWRFAATRALGAWDFSYKTDQVSGLNTPELSDGLAQRHELEASGSIVGLRSRLRYELERDEDGRERHLLRTRESMRVGDQRITHRLSARDGDGRDRTASGQIRLRRGHAHSGRFEIGADYQLAPEIETEAAEVGYSRQLAQNWRMDAQLTGTFNDAPHDARIGLSRRGGSYWRLTSRAEADTDGGWRVFAGLDIGGLPHPDGGWALDPAAGRGYDRGAAVADVRLDGEPVEGVEVCAGFECGESDEGGEAWVPRIRPHEPVNVEVDISSIEDPFVRPAQRGYSFTPRSGRVLDVDVDLHVTGEIDGFVYREDGDGHRSEVSGFEVEAVHQETGEVVQQDTSAFDGLYLLDQLPPGVYQVRATEAQAERLGVPQAATAQQVEVEGGGDLVSGYDLVVHSGGAFVQAHGPKSASDPLKLQVDSETELREQLETLLERMGADEPEGGMEALVADVRERNGEALDAAQPVKVPTDRAPLDRIVYWSEEAAEQLGRLE